MDFRIFTEPQQGATYDQVLTAARTAERAGFGAFFRSDHYQRIGPGDPGPGSTDAWVTLAGLARDTSTIRLGTLVSSATFRLPGPLAIAVAQVDQMSGGRVEFGLGAGWYEAEHTGFGIPFPPVGERFDRLEEQFEIITGMWAQPPGTPYEFSGTHYTITGGTGLPKPAQRPHPPLIVGGGGRVRTPRLAARYADEFNVVFRPVAFMRDQFDRVRKACASIGRDPAEIVFSFGLTMACGRTQAEIRRRMEATGHGPEFFGQGGAAGTPEQCVEQIREYAALGATRCYLQVMDVADVDQISLLAEQVVPYV